MGSASDKKQSELLGHVIGGFEYSYYFDWSNQLSDKNFLEIPMLVIIVRVMRF